LFLQAKGCIFSILLIGTVAQLVEQRTENPCVGGSIPPGPTIEKHFLSLTYRLSGSYLGEIRGIETTVGERRKMKNRGIASENTMNFIHSVLPQYHISV
tara:strand:- start:117 stop:413 length:297 start_codon:yes stop_codon:yes gene_type:complete